MSRAAQMTLLNADNQMLNWSPDVNGEHGEVFTRRWVADLILDLAGYSTEDDLGVTVIVEPSCGSGAFVLPIVERLAESCGRHGRDIAELGSAIRAFDLFEHNVELTRKSVIEKLLEIGLAFDVAEGLVREWIQCGDFLLSDHGDSKVDFVVGNPPYVRLEDVPPQVTDAYRRECTTMRGRADLFVGFYEKGLNLLAPEGRLVYICADRWMRNQYGARLRQMISDDFAVDSVLLMHDVDAFENDVSAYPAITVIRRGEQGETRIVDSNAKFGEKATQRLLPWLANGTGNEPQGAAFEAASLPQWFVGSDHWPVGTPHALELLADLERQFRSLEDSATGTRIGIGVATGCDDVYIVHEVGGVEESRLLPLLTAADISSGVPRWSGRYMVNPWEDGKLVDLADYPGLGGYLEAHGDRVRGRHIAKKRPQTWHRTIDKVDPVLRSRPKLLLPDMKAASHPVLDSGKFYPHHNLYFVVSDVWDLEVLGGLLLSDVTNLFIGAYCVKMRGGTYRFQAQYLRKIRVPDPESIPEASKEALRTAFWERDVAAASAAAWPLYGVSPESVELVA